MGEKIPIACFKVLSSISLRNLRKMRIRRDSVTDNIVTYMCVTVGGVWIGE